MGLAPGIKKSVSDIDAQSESNIATQALDDVKPAFFSESEEGESAKSTKRKT